MPGTMLGRDSKELFGCGGKDSFQSEWVRE
jgi:hypothetical protein